MPIHRVQLKDITSILASIKPGVIRYKVKVLLGYIPNYRQLTPPYEYMSTPSNTDKREIYNVK